MCSVKCIAVRFILSSRLRAILTAGHRCISRQILNLDLGDCKMNTGENCNPTGMRECVAKVATRGIAVIAITLSVSACTVTGNPVQEVMSTDKAVTNSVAKPTKTQGIAGTDVEVIKNAVAYAPVTKRVLPLAWQNPETGSSGSIMAIDKFMGKHGQTCRGFKTSVASFMGIALYNGEACQISPGEWVLSWFKPSE